MNQRDDLSHWAVRLRFPPGWWILPALALSGLAWTALFAWLWGWS